MPPKYANARRSPTVAPPEGGLMLGVINPANRRAVEFLADHLGKAGRIEGLRKKGVSAILQLIAGISGHVDDAQLRIAVEQFLGELRTVHTGHDDVGEQQVDSTVALIVNTERLDTAARFEDAVAPAFQKNPRDLSGGRLIFHYENGLAAAGFRR